MILLIQNLQLIVEDISIHLNLYGQTYHCWKKEGHGYVDMREAMKQSCDTYFYEVARKLGVDKLSETAKKFGLGKKVFGWFI